MPRKTGSTSNKPNDLVGRDAIRSVIQPPDRLIHERMRLAILSALAINKALTFNDLKQLLESTDGNLSVHARRLEEAKLISCKKFFEGRMPRTEYKLTEKGRKALHTYFNHMTALIHTVRGG